MRKLIITADDYGMSKSVNEAIKEGIELNVIKSTNVMLGMDYCRNIVDIKKRFPKVSIGIHWTLTAGKSVEKEERIQTLIDKDGFFLSRPVFVRKFNKGEIKIDHIYRELKAQYSKFYNFIGEPDYWNTHQNIHLNFKLFSLFISIAKELNIKKMRNHERITVPSRTRSMFSYLKPTLEPAKKIILKKWMKNAWKTGFRAPGGSLFLLDSNDKFDFEYICKKAKWKTSSIAELVIHPAKEIDSKYFGSISSKRILEYNYYVNPRIKEMSKLHQITLCGFEEV